MRRGCLDVEPDAVRACAAVKRNGGERLSCVRVGNPNAMKAHHSFKLLSLQDSRGSAKEPRERAVALNLRPDALLVAHGFENARIEIGRNGVVEIPIDVTPCSAKAEKVVINVSVFFGFNDLLAQVQFVSV